MSIRLLFLCLVTVFSIGCGSSSENFVFQGSGDPGSSPDRTGALTFNFVRAQEAIQVPQSTTRLQFAFFSEPGQSGPKTRADEVRDFANSITIENVPVSTKSVRITARDGQGIPLLQVDLEVNVEPGQNTQVDVTQATITQVTLSGLSLSPETQSISFGQNQAYTVSGTYSNGDTLALTGFAGLTWNSTPTSVATINQDGVATGVGVGTAEITASFAGVTSSTANLTVNPIPPVGEGVLIGVAITSATVAVGVDRDPNGVEIPVNGMVAYTATGTFSGTAGITTRILDGRDQVRWRSSNPTVASMVGNTATGVADGTVQVTASVGEVESPTVSLVVKTEEPVLTSIVIVEKVNGGFTAPANSSVTFSARGTFSNNTSRILTAEDGLVWGSDNEAVANNTVGGTFVTGPVVGSTAVLTATAGAQSDSLLLSLGDPIPPVLQSITVTSADPSVIVGESTQLTATGSFDVGPDRPLTAAMDGLVWTSTEQVEVDADGMATGVSVGTAAITAQSGSVTSEPFELEVTVVPTVFTLNTGEAITLPVSSGFAVTLTNSTSGEFVARGNYTVEIDNTAVVTNVNASGVLNTGATVGTTTVRFLIAGTVVAQVEVTTTNADFTALSVTPSSFSVEVGASVPVNATATYANGATLANAQMLSGFTVEGSAEDNVALVNGRLVGLLEILNGTINFDLEGVNSANATVTVTERLLSSYTVRMGGIALGEPGFGNLPRGYRAIVEVDGVFGSQGNQITRPLIPGDDFQLSSDQPLAFIAVSSGLGGYIRNRVVLPPPFGSKATVTLTPTVAVVPGLFSTTITVTMVSPTISGTPTVKFENYSEDDRLILRDVDVEVGRKVDIRANFVDVPNFRIADADIEEVFGSHDYDHFPSIYLSFCGCGTEQGWTTLFSDTANLTPDSVTFDISSFGETTPMSVRVVGLPLDTIKLVDADTGQLPNQAVWDARGAGQGGSFHTRVTYAGGETQIRSLDYPPVPDSDNVLGGYNLDGSLSVFFTDNDEAEIVALDYLGEFLDLFSIR